MRGFKYTASLGFSAINQTIAKSQATELKFKVNTDEELTAAEFAEKYGEEGYAVAFLYNKTDSNDETHWADAKQSGVVNTSDNFKYAVQVTNPEGNLIPADVVAADFADVTVVDATTATKVLEIGLEANDEAWKNATVTDADGVAIVATVFENALGQKNTDKDANGDPVANITAPTIETATSSAPAVASYDKVNKKIVVRDTGEVTFTVKFAGLEGTHAITVNVVDKQEVASIDAKDQKVKAATADEELTFVVLDASGDAMRTTDAVFYTLTKKGAVEAKEATTTGDLANGKATLKVNLEKGEYTVNVYTKEDKSVKLGSFAVGAINVSEDATIDEYRFEFANKDVTNLDLKPAEENGVTVGSLEVKVTPLVSDIAVAMPEGVKVKSSNKDVFTAAFKADDKTTIKVKIPVENAKIGKANIVLYTREGDLVTELATFEVEVKNTATQYETLTLKPNTKVNGLAEGKLVAAVIAAVKEDVTPNQIDHVVPLVDDGLVLVYMEESYGGKVIPLAADFEMKADFAFAEDEAEGFNITTSNVTDLGDTKILYQIKFSQPDNFGADVTSRGKADDAQQETWSIANGTALFGPEGGFKVSDLEALMTKEGVTTNFILANATPTGECKFTVSIVEAATGNKVLATSKVFTFTVPEAEEGDN